MAELIDKNGAIKLIEKEFDMNCLTEWGQGYIDAMNDVKGIIALLPTTTEAEIRAMAYEKFSIEAVRQFIEFDEEHDFISIGVCLDIIAKVADQLKEE